MVKKRKKKKIIFSRHALDRMFQRKVSEQDVIKTIDKPTKKLPKGKDNTQEYIRKVNGKSNFVVVGVGDKQIVVITTGWAR
jgi:hypothetical protein